MNIEIKGIFLNNKDEKAKKDKKSNNPTIEQQL